MPVKEDVDSIEQLQKKEFGINYVSVGETHLPTVVFIHGTPGNWRSFASYLADPALTGRARLVSIDRPGWHGSSDHESKISLGPLSFAEQSRQLLPLLEKFHRESNGRGLIVVGHSLGASIAPRLAMDHPQLVDGLVLLSGTFNPTLGKPRWYHHLASTWLVGWMIGSELRQANKEMLTLKHDLETMSQNWKLVDMPVTVIQGMKDWLVSPRNIDYMATVFADNPQVNLVLLPKAGHFIPWKNRHSVTKAIGQMLLQLRPASELAPGIVGQ